METNQPNFLSITIKAIIVHTVTYFAIGFLAFTFFHYSARFSEGGLELLMRPANDLLAMAGPLFQPLRGILFGLVFYLFRNDFLSRKTGWLRMWIALVVVGIFSTFGAAPGSIEGLIYTTLPVRSQFSVALLEVLIQSLLLSYFVFYWVNNSKKRWISWVFGSLFVISLLLPLAGIIAAS